MSAFGPPVARLPVATGLALIFDLDGVIVDSMPLHTQAWLRYLEQLGIDSPHRADSALQTVRNSPVSGRVRLRCAGEFLERNDLVTRMHGRRNDEIVREFLGPDLPNEILHEHGAAKERLFREMMGENLTRSLVPGIENFLARTEGLPVALATNAEPANVAFALNGANLRRWFKAVVDGSQVQNAKPAPDVFLAAGERLGVAPRNCIVFEDSPTGITAARAAGMRVVGILTHAAMLDDVDVAVPNFLDPELEQWLALQSPL